MPDMSKIGRSNVNRAKAHERQVAKWLTEWSGVEFRRRRVTGRDHATTVIDGTADVICTRPDFKYAVECKSGAGFSLDAVMAGGGKTKFDQWWNQALEDAELSGKEPMLFIKPGTGQNWIATKRGISLWPKDAGQRGTEWRASLGLDLPHETAVVFHRAEDFFEYVDPRPYFDGDLP